MSEAIWVAIISGFFGIVGAVAGAVIGSKISRKSSLDAVESSNKNAVDIMKGQEFIVASAKLRATFAPAQVKLSFPRELGNIELRKFFDDAFLLHASAIEEFRPFASDGVAYQKAYDEYREALFEDDALGDANLRWSSNMVITDGIENHQNFIDYLKGKVENVLHFASPK